MSDQLFNLRHIRLTRARVFTCRLRGAEWADPREALQVKYQLNSLTALKRQFAIVRVLVQNACSDVKSVKCGAMVHTGSVRPVDSTSPSINPTVLTAFNHFSDRNPEQ